MSYFTERFRRVDPQRDILTPEDIRRMEEARHFFERLKKRPLITTVLLAIIIALWLFSLILGILESPQPLGQWLYSLALGGQGQQQALVILGAKINFLIDHGQSWRLASPLFLHFGLLHILFNGYALYLLGRIVENLYGRRRFLLIYFISGIFSILSSYFGSEHISVGASGAIFGLLGAAAVMGYKHREEIPPVFRRFFGRGLLPWIVLNLSLGLFIDGIDNYAHVGGLVAGSLTAFFLRARISETTTETRLQHAGLSLGAAAVAILLVFTFFHMFISVSGEDTIDPPKHLRSVSLEGGRIKADIPSALMALDTSGEERTWQYVEPYLGFWLALQQVPGRKLSYEALIEELWTEIDHTPEIDRDSIRVVADAPADINGHRARRIHLSFNLNENEGSLSGGRHELTVWLIPTGDGLTKATCSAPGRHYKMFDGWCKGFIASLEV